MNEGEWLVAVNELTATEQDGRADFDFFVGMWKVHNRRLQERLKGSDAWEEFDGVSVARKVLGGMGNVDELTLERASGRQEGMTVRLFDPSTRQWYLYWASGAIGAPLDIPMIEAFKDGRGGLRPGNLGWKGRLQPLRLVKHHGHLVSLGTGALA